MKAIYIQSCKRNKVGLILLTFFSVTMKKEKGCIGCIMLCYGMGVTKVHPYEWLNWNWAFMFIEIVWSQGENCPFGKPLFTVIGETADIISKGHLLSTLDNNRVTHPACFAPNFRASYNCCQSPENFCNYPLFLLVCLVYNK